jgi:NADPH oxidase
MLHGIQRLVKAQTNVNEHNPKICAPLYHQWDRVDQCKILPRFAGTNPTSWMWLAGPLAIYIIERILRFIRSLQKVEVVGAIRHESNVIEIRFHKPAMTTPQPGQYIYVKCFSLAKFEWHPFTVTSAAEDDYVSVHIRQVGDWTKALANKLAKYPEDVPRLSIDGPYGSPADDVFNYDGVVLVGAGIGGRERFKKKESFFNSLYSSHTLCGNIKTYSFISIRESSTSSCLFLLDV